MRLQDKVATITGAASGIGKAAAELFAAEGARVVVADVSERRGKETAEEITAGGGAAAFIRTDVRDAAQVKAMVDFAVETYGRLDVMFNNAGIGSTQGGPADVPDDDWDTTMSVNLRGIYLCCRYGIPELIKSGGGSIVNTASIGAFLAGSPTGMPATSSYSVSKAGVVQLTRTVAWTYGRQGVRANAVLPGMIATRGAVRVPGITDVEQTFIAHTPLGKVGKPEDVAKLALFLASDDSSHITGTSMIIDGGYSLNQGAVYTG